MSIVDDIAQSLTGEKTTTDVSLNPAPAAAEDNSFLSSLGDIFGKIPDIVKAGGNIYTSVLSAMNSADTVAQKKKLAALTAEQQAALLKSNASAKQLLTYGGIGIALLGSALLVWKMVKK
jgi:hypothetical protein